MFWWLKEMQRFGAQVAFRSVKAMAGLKLGASRSVVTVYALHACAAVQREPRGLRRRAKRTPATILPGNYYAIVKGKCWIGAIFVIFFGAH